MPLWWTEEISHQVPDAIAGVEHEGQCNEELRSKDDASSKLHGLYHGQVMRVGAWQQHCTWGSDTAVTLSATLQIHVQPLMHHKETIIRKLYCMWHYFVHGINIQWYDSPISMVLSHTCFLGLCDSHLSWVWTYNLCASYSRSPLVCTLVTGPICPWDLTIIAF